MKHLMQPPQPPYKYVFSYCGMPAAMIDPTSHVSEVDCLACLDAYRTEVFGRIQREREAFEKLLDRIWAALREIDSQRMKLLE